MKYKVEALDTYEEKNIKDKELGYIPKAGEQFEVTRDRLNVLLRENDYHLTFVKIVETKENKESIKEVAVNKAKRKTTKKAK